MSPRCSGENMGTYWVQDKVLRDSGGSCGYTLGQYLMKWVGSENIARKAILHYLHTQSYLSRVTKRRKNNKIYLICYKCKDILKRGWEKGTGSGDVASSNTAHD
ncbi:hypothetical protein JHK87_009722 [Glycine soja]|nr:hypothetical protein JHK87_009722 [Glycine soja]